MSQLLEPLSLGTLKLQHRVVLAPLTRYRANEENVPLEFVKEYYAQRASTPGTLLITEGTFISARAGGFSNVPGIFTRAQIEAWRAITDAVHAKGSFIFCQLWALGRAADPKILAAGGFDVVSSSGLPMPEGGAVPRPLDEQGIQEFIDDYATAARNAIEAGFDGVEIHGANGYLCDQFLQDNCNDRTDRWGGSIENRSRFGLEVARAVAAAIGAERTGYRMSPWSPFQGMKMRDLVPQFTYHTKNLAKLKLAYIHVVEPRISGAETIAAAAEEIDFIVNAWGDAGVLIMAGGFTAQSAEAALQKYKDRNIAIAFGRHFIANPDLPFRIAQGIALNKYNRSTFYSPMARVGYVDYPFSNQFLVGEKSPA